MVNKNGYTVEVIYTNKKVDKQQLYSNIANAILDIYQKEENNENENTTKSKYQSSGN
ncbi:MAG: hypothetical protein ACLR60_03465 [Clostridium paraputrificum]